MRRVVLLDEAGSPIGEAAISEVHNARTPLHLAFSCYGFDAYGYLLVTQRALDKQTFPGVWTNTCCGHPEPGEPVESAVVRRVQEELGLSVTDLVCALPSFRYRAEMNDIVENELCPVFLGRLSGRIGPDPTEVRDFRWQSWEDFVLAATPPGSAMSPWSRLQVAELVETGMVASYLRLAGGAQRPAVRQCRGGVSCCKQIQRHCSN